MLNQTNISYIQDTLSNQTTGHVRSYVQTGHPATAIVHVLITYVTSVISIP